MRSSANIVKSISGVDVEFSDATWSNLAERVADEVKEAAVDVAGGFSFGAGIAAVVAFILWWKK
jgi:alpha/beta superfamily hydrolase